MMYICAVTRVYDSWGLLKVTRSPTPQCALRSFHGHSAAAQGFTWGGLAKKPTANPQLCGNDTVQSRHARGHWLEKEKKKAAERNTDNSYPWTNPLDFKTRPWLMPPNPLLTAARRRKGEFDFRRAGSLSAPCCGRRSENSSVDVFLAASRRRESCARGGRGNTREKGRSPYYCKKT